jgi:hypothetical protein
MVTLLGRTAPSPETDVVAAALATGKGDSVLGLRLAIRLPLSAGADAPVTSAVAAFLANESADRIHELVDDSDEEIRALMDIATPLTARWFATDDRSFLEMAVANRDHRSWTPAADGLPGLGGTRVVRFVREAGDVASSTGAPKEGVDKVSDAFGSVIRGSASVRGLTGTQLRGAGQALLALAEAGGDVDGPISEIQSSVSSMQPGEAVEWTGLVEEVVEHLPATTGDLVPKLIERCLVNREIDLARVRWLLRHGADRTDTLDAVVHEVGSHSPTAETVELLRPLRAPLKRKWQVREALVLRASQDPHSTDTPLLLEEAREWSQVPRTKRSDYDSALDALVVNPALNPVLSELAR